MKTLPLTLLALLTATGATLQSQDIIDEALKITPPGFTDLVPRKDNTTILERNRESRTFKPALPSAGTQLTQPAKGDLEALTNELKALRKENAELKAKLSEIQRLSR
ncbi:MAG: hypothetical protein ACAI34_03880 [Verrucomicrobium sp.]|nr:hypothetical protein [Verrucomicrobium sp.]